MANIQKTGVLEKSLDVLEFIYNQGGRARIRRIVEGLGYNKSTVHRIVNTLKKRGYLVQDCDTTAYLIGPRFSAFSQMYLGNLHFIDALKPHLRNASVKYNECLNVSVLDVSSVDAPKQVSVYRTGYSSNMLGSSLQFGLSYYCHASASGKCFLAFCDSKVLQEFYGCALKRYTSRTIVDWSTLMNCIESIRSNGFAEEDGEFEVGLKCIAVPVFEKNGLLLASLSLTGASERINDFDQAEIVSDLKAIAEKAR